MDIKKAEMIRNGLRELKKEIASGWDKHDLDMAIKIIDKNVRKKRKGLFK